MTAPNPNAEIGPMALARFLLCAPFYVMMTLMVVEASLSATTSYLVIETGRNVANGTFSIADLLWIWPRNRRPMWSAR